MLDDKSPTSANLGNDHEFIIKEYSLRWYEVFLATISIGMSPFGEAQKLCELKLRLDNIIPRESSSSNNQDHSALKKS